ncbi:MAG: cation transporter [Leptospiraceae bacterium]|jgi:Co/Zn/Cd efflux system component|nr:cation transporter [Leptospiraceae bacterium]MBK9502683.1 cation transporter [Leptospiraceae bacterium]MBL0266981.1 cation transporter [Leptospiraceae bacterium]
MHKTIFHIKKMDCPSEEQMIRMKLGEFTSIKELSFDLVNRNLSIIHENHLDKIQSAIDSLQLGASISKSSEYTGEISKENNKIDRKILWLVLIINFTFFLVEMIYGYLANSIGLVADSLDMLADAFVYGLSLYAITGTFAIKKRVAIASGYIQLSLAVLGLLEVFRRFFRVEEVPDFKFMISISFLALLANTLSLILLNQSKSKEVHIVSSQIFTSNDIIANIGVILAGILVLFFKSNIPDLIVGLLVFFFVVKGAIRILQLSKDTR